MAPVVDVAAICKGAREKGVPVLVDGSQAAVHMPVDVQAIGCDFYAVTGHKLYGPSGSGAIYIRADRQAEMRPFMGGGDMIREVTRNTVTWNDPPMKFEAGTPNVDGAVGLTGLQRSGRIEPDRFECWLFGQEQGDCAFDDLLITPLAPDQLEAQASAGQLLRRTPHAGKLFRAGLWLY